MERSSVMVVAAEHEGVGEALLQQRGQDAAVQGHQTLNLQLTNCLHGPYSMELLPEHGLIDGEGDQDVDVPRQVSGHELVPCWFV